MEQRRNETEFAMEGKQHTYLSSRKGKHWKIIVGWDNPLETFFAQVWEEYVKEPRGVEDGDALELLVGTCPKEIPTLEELEAIVEPYGPIPDWAYAALEEAYAGRTPPTDLQRKMSQFMKW
jgi:hypothetical protein